MNSGLIRTCAILFLAFSPVAVKSQQTAPDVILFNGKIFTSDAAHPYVQGLAIRGDRIVAAGDSNKIRALAGSHTKQIDLDGRTVIPGINDAHNHLGIAPETVEFESPNPTLAEVSEAIVAAARKMPPGAIVYGWIGQSAYFTCARNDRTHASSPLAGIFPELGHGRRQPACPLSSRRRHGLGPTLASNPFSSWCLEHSLDEAGSHARDRSAG